MTQTIKINVLDGNLSNEIDPTRDQVDDYVDMLENALTAEFPGFEIDVVLHRRVSGYAGPTFVWLEEDDDPREELAIAEEADRIANHVWVAWCEKHEIA